MSFIPSVRTKIITSPYMDKGEEKENGYWQGYLDEDNAMFVAGFDFAVKNLSSQAYAHVFSANFAADCVKNACRAPARLRIFSLSATKLCSKIRTHFL